MTNYDKKKCKEIAKQIKFTVDNELCEFCSNTYFDNAASMKDLIIIEKEILRQLAKLMGFPAK